MARGPYTLPNSWEQGASDSGQRPYARQEPRERLTAFAPERWVHGRRDFLAQGQLQPDSTRTLPASALARWTQQMNTSYHELPETQKDSDCAEAQDLLRFLNPVSDTRIIAADENCV